MSDRRHLRLVPPPPPPPEKRDAPLAVGGVILPSVKVPDVVIESEGERAYYVVQRSGPKGGPRWAWIPKAQIRPGSVSTVGDVGDLFIPQWLAADRGFRFEPVEVKGVEF